MERGLDKRKARDKETDDDLSDATNTKNPMKRARVEYSSASPKEKSPSPASAQRSPMGKVVDTFAATAPSSLGQKSDNNGDHAMASSSSANPVISKFDLPSPFTTQELEQLEKNKDGKQDSDSDDDSTKFYTDIMQSEENKKKRQIKSKSGSGSGSSSSNGTPVVNSKRVDKGSSSNNGKAGGTKSSQQPLLTSSPNSEQSSIWSSSGSGEVEVVIKIYEPTTRQILLEETVLRSDAPRMEAFLKQHSLKLSLSSHSGYLGDISSHGNSAETVQSASKNRWTISSLGSTIPRQSIVSIATDTSEISEVMKRPGRPPPTSKSRKRSDGPILSSTKIDESSNSSNVLSRMNVSGNSMSNGEDHSTTGTSSKSQSSKGTETPARKGKTASNSKFDHDEGFGTMASQTSTPGSSKKNKSGIKGTSNASTPTGPAANKPTGERPTKKPAVRRRGGSASNFPITTPATAVVLSTPPPARSVAKIEGTSAKPLNKFEQEMNDEPVIESELKKGASLWSAILPEELVFARWRDKNYYSGMVKSKGLNDTWVIDFDDGMEDVASESHIVPIRILGVGTIGIYSPDAGYQPHNAEVIGQKFGADADGTQWVKYAIKCEDLENPIWCSRRQLSIKEPDAKKLRSDYLPPAQGKAGDVSLDNIVSGPRRRTRGNEPENGNEKSLIAGAFDQSVGNSSNSESTVTPKTRGPKGGKKTPATEPKKKRGANTNTNTNTPQNKDVSTSPPVKDVAVAVIKELPAKSPKYATVEIGKKKPKKSVFQGLQFFLTASGGGDPGISGNALNMLPPLAYDKDEFRELIESSGGEVVDAVGDESDKNVFLISDSYARTVKYIYCLAGSIACVSHTWVTACLDKVVKCLLCNF
ncbi:unnamed protein product [Orchesella dallaii]|uniref:BRCT domain-containing protein n=1 Tax=Orchesella dallaii TaxID=48710 RepID=A0ABP1Q3W1_9HEXA